MAYAYPYKSQLRKKIKKDSAGIDYYVWDSGELDTLVAQTNMPIIEIGGPTFDGYYLLDTALLTSKPVITNISKDPLPYATKAKIAAKKIDSIVDGTNMPYEDASISMFLMKCMSYSSDWWVNLPDQEKNAASKIFNKEYTSARVEMGQVSAGILNPYNVQYAVRIKIYAEVKRCLEKGGLFLTDGTTEDIVVLQKLGFTLVAYIQSIENICSSYEFVMKKAH